MYFLYVDGSGQTKIRRNIQDNGMYILSGVLVHEKDWRSVEKRLADVKRDLFPRLRPDKWELHAQEIWNSKGFFAKEELGLNFAKKKEIFSRVVDAACKSAITIVGVVVFKDALEQRRSSVVMKSSWRRLTSRFESFLKQNPLHADDGLFFIDSSQKTPEAEIKGTILAEVRRRGGRLGTHRVIENPLFVASHRWGLIQLADMIAYVVHRHYRQDSRFEEWFQSLEPKMYRSGGRLFGFGINEIPDSH